jgi:hypothetical protein
MIRYCSTSKHPFLLSIHNPKSYLLFQFALHCTTSSTRQYNVDTPRRNQPKSPSVLLPMPSVLTTTTALVAHSNYPFPREFILPSFPSSEFQRLPASPTSPKICKMGATKMQQRQEQSLEFPGTTVGDWVCGPLRERERERERL